MSAVVTKAPPLPHLALMEPWEIERVATVRGLDPRAVRIAALEFQRIFSAEWPRWFVGGRWIRPCVKHFLSCGMDSRECAPREVFDSWCITDDARRVGEFRRLDGEKFPRSDGEGIKAWSTAGKSWPVGVTDIARLGLRNVLFVEGGPDQLAGFHFLFGFEMLRKVAVVGMLGASNSIAEDALPLFAGCRVRIVEQADPLKVQVRKLADGRVVEARSVASRAASLRWHRQLVAAGAVVEVWHLYDCDALERGEFLPAWRRADGAAVEDLNDLALADAAVVGSAEVEEAFCDWDF